MIRMMWQLLKTALVVRELIALGLFAEVRITRGAWGLENRLFVIHHGVQSVMSLRAAVGLCEAIRRDKRYDQGAKRVSSGRC